MYNKTKKKEEVLKMDYTNEQLILKLNSVGFSIRKARFNCKPVRTSIQAFKACKFYNLELRVIDSMCILSIRYSNQFMCSTFRINNKLDLSEFSKYLSKF